MTHTSDEIERIRQAIMRWRELLDILASRQEASEAAYAALFQHLSEDERAVLKEKEQQWRIAEQIAEDTEELRRGLLKMRFAMRDLEREFESTHDNLI